MSLRDFKLGLIVIEKFKFPQGSLKNAEHHFSDRFYFITFTNVNRFLVTIADLNRLKKKAVSHAKTHQDLAVQFRKTYSGISHFQNFSDPFWKHNNRTVSRFRAPSFPRPPCCQTCPLQLVLKQTSIPLKCDILTSNLYIIVRAVKQSSFRLLDIFLLLSFRNLELRGRAAQRPHSEEICIKGQFWGIKRAKKCCIVG